MRYRTLSASPASSAVGSRSHDPHRRIASAMGRKPLSFFVFFFSRSLPFPTPIPLHRHPWSRVSYPLPLSPSSSPTAASRPFSTSTIPSSSCSSDEEPSSISASETELRSETHMDFVAKAYSGIGKSVISKCSYIWEEKAETFMEKSSLQDVLVLGLNLSPETIRRFWRVPELKPEGFLEILLGFGSDVSLRTVDFLWNLFRWAETQSNDYGHLQKSYEVMVWMLIKAGMLEEAESLLLSVEVNRVFSDASMMFSEIIQSYAEACKLEKSIVLYNLARDEGVIPSGSCYQALLSLLIKKEKAEAILRVYRDMLEFGLGSYSEEHAIHCVILELTKKDKIVEALNIIRRVKNSGVEAPRRALSAIAEGFCRKRDFNDMLNFLEEWSHIPEVSVCNKIASSLCASLGTQEAWLFVQRMEILGFIPDSITFGTFICQSCKEGKLRDAFIYLSECFSRSVEPKVYAYNALIGGVFKEGLYRHAKYVFDDLVEKGLIPDLSTFRILLAGYCKYRKFDEIEQVLSDMNNYGVDSPAPGECAFSKALMFLGLDYLGVKVKRDNDVGLPKAEFFDSVGNGLYLETDSEKYETLLDEFLDTAVVPDFDSAIITDCKHGNIENALKLKDEVIQWGKNITLATYSEFLKRLCAIPSHVKEAMCLVEQFPEFLNQLDSETLNLLVRTLSKNGMGASARRILEQLLRKDLLVGSDTYTCLLTGFCEERNIVGFWECWKLAKRSNWSPMRKEIIVIISCLCKWGMIKDALELIDGLVDYHPELINGFYNGLIKELCMTGYTSLGCAMVEATLERGLNLDSANLLNLIKGFLKEQKVSEALGLLDIWLNKNTPISTGLYQLMLPKLLRFDNVERAIDLAQYVQHKQPGCVASIHSTLVEELCRIGKTKDAIFILQEMLVNKTSLDNNILNALIQSYSREDNWRKAQEVLCIVVRMHANLSISGYRSLLRQFCMHNQFHNALHLQKLIEIESQSKELILYNILIFYLFRAGNVSLVECILKDMHVRYIALDEVSYNFLVYGFCKCQNLKTAVETLNAFIAKGLKPSTRSLRIVISHFCSQGNIDKALELYKMMERNNWKRCLVIENTIALSLLSIGRHREAELLLNRMNGQEVNPAQFNYDLLIKEFCVKGGMNKAVDLLNKMLKKGNLPSEISYSSIIQRMCICKEFDRALDFFAEMQYNNLKPSKESCNALICGLCDAGKVDEAKGLLGTMLQIGLIPTHTMYNYVIDKYHANNNLNKAAELLGEMQRAGYSPNFGTHWSIISNLSSNSNKKKIGENGRSFLSSLLSGADLKVKHNEDKGSSGFKYAPFFST